MTVPNKIWSVSVSIRRGEAHYYSIDAANYQQFRSAFINIMRSLDKDSCIDIKEESIEETEGLEQVFLIGTTLIIITLKHDGSRSSKR